MFYWAQSNLVFFFFFLTLFSFSTFSRHNPNIVYHYLWFIFLSISEKFSHRVGSRESGPFNVLIGAQLWRIHTARVRTQTSHSARWEGIKQKRRITEFAFTFCFSLTASEPCYQKLLNLAIFSFIDQEFHKTFVKVKLVRSSSQICSRVSSLLRKKRNTITVWNICLNIIYWEQEDNRRRSWKSIGIVSWKIVLETLLLEDIR